MSIDQDRLDRERAYHNDRFQDETREAQGKYYFALRDLNQTYYDAILERAKLKDVLEYGCAKGEVSVPIANVARSLQGIDISDTAIDAARAAAVAAKLKNASFAVMNAEALNFPDGSFDLVFGSGILHHLDLSRAYAEIARVLRPGGKAIFKEPLGHNAAFNLYRALTPGARTVDEHPLLRKDVLMSEAVFGHVRYELFGLATLAAVPFRNSALGNSVYSMTASLDRALLRIPGIRWQAWHILMEMTRS